MTTTSDSGTVSKGRAARQRVGHATRHPEPGQPEGEAPLELPQQPLGERVSALLVITLPIVGLVAAIVYAWGHGVGWIELGLMLGMYVLTGLGVTVGYHRLFTHKSFSTGPVITAILGVLGSMSLEGALIRWVAFHRCHHQHSDDEGDPHSPHGHGSGVKGVLKGFFHAHVGWVLGRADPTLVRYVADLRRNKLVRRVSDLFPLWIVLSLAIPTVLGGLLAGSWTGAMLGFVWGGLVRILVVHHVTWSVNSICHLWGWRHYRSHDHSRNNPIVGVLAFGEGWHNNHHAFPTSARHGLAWWQFDLSYLVIWTLERVGLAWNVRLPAADRLAAQTRTPQGR